MVEALPLPAGAMDRLRAALTGFAADDPCVTTPRRTPPTASAGPFSRACPSPSAGARTPISRVRSRARGPPPRRRAITAVNAALVLAIDHDLAVSTFAARVAASARADGYAAVSAALGAADSPLHISAATRTARLLARVNRGQEPERALTDALQEGNGIPGFGHPLYTGGDDRAAALFPLLAGCPTETGRWMPCTGCPRSSPPGRGLLPNVDLALAALVSGARLPDDAASTIFVLGRIAGWIAHIAAEYAEPAMRLRPRGEYVGP